MPQKNLAFFTSPRVRKPLTGKTACMDGIFLKAAIAVIAPASHTADAAGWAASLTEIVT